MIEEPLFSKQESTVSRDSEANLSVDEDDQPMMGRVGYSAHRCSMIKKYSIDTYFLGASPAPKLLTNRAAMYTANSNMTTVNSRPVSKPASIMVTEDRDPSEVVLMKAVSEVDEETKTRDSDEMNRQRPTLGLILKSETDDNTFQVSPDEETAGTEQINVPNRVSKNFAQEDQDEELMKQNTMELCKEVFSVSDSAVVKTETSPDRILHDMPSNEPEAQSNYLNNFVTKVPEYSENNENQAGEIDLHRQHFEHTLQALNFIRNHLTVVQEDLFRDKFIYLPPPVHGNQKKLLIFDMDETLIHCVDDIDTQNPDVILEIDFPGEETVCAGINLRPYLMQCLQEANKKF